MCFHSDIPWPRVHPGLQQGPVALRPGWGAHVPRRAEQAVRPRTATLRGQIGHCHCPARGWALSLQAARHPPPPAGRAFALRSGMGPATLPHPTPRGAAQDCNTLRGGLRPQHSRSSRNQTISRMEVGSVVFCHFWLNSSSFVLWCFQAKVKRSHAYKREGIISGRKIVWLHLSYF